MQEVLILIVEDDRYYSRSMKKKLELYGTVTVVDSFESAINALSLTHFDIALIDINLGGPKSGLDVLDFAEAQGTYSIVLTESVSSELIKDAYQRGCDNFLTKGQGELVIQDAVRNFIENMRKDNLLNSFNFYTTHEELASELKLLPHRIGNSRPVMLLGENGTGKSKISKIIHSISSSSENFYKIKLQSSSIAEIRDFLLADLESMGDKWFSKFENSTLYLDGVPALPLSEQEYILRLIKRSDFKSFNIQIIASATDSILRSVKEGLFLEELFLSLSDISIKIPPLRERKDDIPLLINHILRLGNKGHIKIDQDAMDCLQKYDWPTNVKELFSTITDLTNAYKFITKDRLPGGVTSAVTLRRHHYDDTKFLSDEHRSYLFKYGLNGFVERAKLEAVKELMKNNEFKTGKAWEQSKISRAAFFRLVKKSMRELGNYGQTQ